MYSFEIMSVVCSAPLWTIVQFMQTVGEVLFRYRMENTRHMDLNLSSHIRSSRLVVLKLFMVRRRVSAFDHPPYSPNLVLANFFQFSYLKQALKWERFLNPDIQSHVTRVIYNIPEEDFVRSFQKLLIDRHYFEGI